MKREDISKAVGDIADRHVTAGAEKGTRRSRRWLWSGAVAAVLAVAILCGVLFGPGSGGAFRTYAVAAPEYPQMAPYPKEGWSESWAESRRLQREQPEGYADGLESFYTATMTQFLSGEDGANRVYSPLNLYLALGMLAELTDGESRAQVLELLGVESIEDLRVKAAALWNASYCDDGAITSVLASSLWLNKDVSFVQETMDTLAKTYYASSFQGEMGSPGLNKALQGWLNEQTRGLLEKQASQVELDPRTVLALATTVYFKAAWSSEFDKSQTQDRVFHAPAGDVTCPFLYQSTTAGYYWGERFGAIGRGLKTGGCMWFLLPDEGTTAEELLGDPEAVSLILNGYSGWENMRDVIVHEYIPKFDVSGSLDLIDGLKELGVVDVFDSGKSDFTPMTGDADDVYVSQATHAARVRIDEKGVEGAAFTVLGMGGGGMPPEDEIDFVLDRPFLFAVQGLNGMTLFVGVVNDPAG